ncbi:MAG TPA: hypothetical protein VHB98_04135 [Chloroflexota bacterium]|nr:hypothetical protein [Chloroflexota bacterium]
MTRRHRLAHWLVLAGIALGSAGCVGSWQAAAHPLAAHKTYTNAKFGYAVNYPTNWKRSTLSGIQFAAFAPDHNAFITANAVPGTLTVAQIKTAQKGALTNLGTLQGTISYGPRSIHGVTFQLAEALVKNKAGSLLDAVLIDTVRHGSLYVFNAGVVQKLSLTNKETTAVLNSLNSITIQ